MYRHIFRALERAVTNGALTPGCACRPNGSWRSRSEGQPRDGGEAPTASSNRAGWSRGYVGRGTFVSAAPDSSGAPFAWRGKVAAAALRTNDTARHPRSHPCTRATRRCSRLGRRHARARKVSRRRVPPIVRSRAAPRRPTGLGAKRHRGADGAARGDGRPVRRPAGKHPRFSPAHSRGSICSRAVSSIPATRWSIDRPGYLGAIHTFRAAGARLVGWDVVRHDLDELEDLLVRYRPKLIYTNPTFQNPTGWTMPIRLRRDFLELAGRLRVPIIEDDTYRELWLGDEPPPTLHSLDTRSVVIHLSSFSKVLAPGLRLGWLSAAEPIVEQLALIKQSADPHAPNLMQSIVADLIEDGDVRPASDRAASRTSAAARRARRRARAARRVRPPAVDKA